MSGQNPTDGYDEFLDKVNEALTTERPESVLAEELIDRHPSEIGLALESIPHREREQLWNLLTPAQQAQVLIHLHETVRDSLIEGMDSPALIAVVENMDVDDLADIIEILPKDVTTDLFQGLDARHRQRLETTLSFEEGTAGRLMYTDVVSIRADLTMDKAQRYLRRRGLPSHSDGVMVTDRDGNYLGKLFFSALLGGDSGVKVAEVMDTEADWVAANMPEHEVANLFERHDLISAAVVDEEGKLLGHIPVIEAMRVIRAEGDQALLQMSGFAEEEDLFAPMLPSARRRAVWLGINLVTAFLAAWVIGLFSETLEKVVALAVLMPIVASMGGIAGSQTLTLIIRGLALNQVGSANARWLTGKELSIGTLNGLLWALVVAVVAMLWFHDYRIGVVIAAAMVINLVAAALSGIAIPLVLKRMGIDPALSGAVILTTVTDVVGFMSFLGLGTLFLL